MFKKFFILIYRFFLRKFKEKQKNAILYANEYLEKFDYSAIPENKETNNNEMSECIWQLWYQGEDSAPLIVKKCLQSVKKFNPDKKIIVLDDNSIDKYIEIPLYIKTKYQAGIITKAHYSDYIRTCLLSKYGGIWIDATVLLTDIIPKEIVNQDFFVFKNPLWFNRKIVPSENLFKTFLTIDKDAGLYGSNWFIVSKPNNTIINLQKELLEQYWEKENSLIHYFLYHLFISKTLIKNTACKQIFESMYSLSNKEPHILQSLLHDKFDPDLSEGIKYLTPIHKLTYKFDKITKNSFLQKILKEEI